MAFEPTPQPPPPTMFGLLAFGDPNTPVSLADGVRVKLPSGLTLGSVDSAGVRWRVSRIRGWDDVTVRGATTAREYGHGSWPDPSYLDERVIRIDGTAYAPDRATLREARNRLALAVPLDTLRKVDVDQHGVTQYALMRQADGTLPWTHKGAGIADWTLSLVNPDGRRLHNQVWQQSTGLPSSVGGLTFPFTFPVTFPATVTSGRVIATAFGTIAGPARLRIDGPALFPTVRHGELDRTLTFNLELDDGQHLLIDLDTHDVLLNGTASRRGKVAGEWFTIAPRIDKSGNVTRQNTLHFNASEASPTASMTVTWQDADK